MIVATQGTVTEDLCATSRETRSRRATGWDAGSLACNYLHVQWSRLVQSTQLHSTPPPQQSLQICCRSLAHAAQNEQGRPTSTVVLPVHQDKTTRSPTNEPSLPAPLTTRRHPEPCRSLHLRNQCKPHKSEPTLSQSRLPARLRHTGLRLALRRSRPLSRHCQRCAITLQIN